MYRSLGGDGSNVVRMIGGGGDSLRVDDNDRLKEEGDTVGR